MHIRFHQRFQALPPFVQKAGLSFGLRFGGLFIQFLISVLVSRLLGAERFGAFTYAFVWATMLGTFLTFGLSRLAVREIPHFLSRQDRGHVLGYIAVTGGTILAGGVLSGMFLLVLEQMRILVLAPGWLAVAAVGLAHAAILSLAGLLNGFQIIIWPQFIESILRQAIYAALIGGALWAGWMITPRNLFPLYLASAVPTLLMLVLLLRGALRRQIPGSAPLTTDGALLWYKSAVPLLLSVFAGFFNSNLDILMIGSMLGDLETGLYRAAVRGALLVSIANMVSLQVLGPMLSRALAEQNEAGAQRFLAWGALVSFVAGISIALLLALFSHPFLALFGSEFPAATDAMRLLLAGQAINVLVGGAGILLVLQRQEQRVLMTNLTGLALNAVLNFVLIRIWGIEGAAIATAITTAFVGLRLLSIVLGQKRFDPTLFSAWRLWRARRSR